MIPIYTFYADIFWLNQFLQNTSAMLLAGEVSKRTSLRMFIRTLTASAIGAALSVTVLLLFRSYYVYLLSAYVLILPLMTLLGFGREPPRLWLTHLSCCFGTTLLIGGLVYALENITDITQIPFLTTFCSFLIARMIIRRFHANARIRRLLVPVTLEHKGCCFNGLGFWDTGNLLRAPCSGKPIHMLSPSVMTELSITQDDFLGLVSCRTVSSSDGLLEIYHIDNLSIMDNKKSYSIPDIIIAKAPAELFIGKEYQIILHSDTMDENISP